MRNSLSLSSFFVFVVLWSTMLCPVLSLNLACAPYKSRSGPGNDQLTNFLACAPYKSRSGPDDDQLTIYHNHPDHSARGLRKTMTSMIRTEVIHTLLYFNLKIHSPSLYYCNSKKAGMACQNIFFKKAIQVVISFAVVFGLLVFCSD